MSDRLPDATLDQVFRTARTHNGWDSTPIPEATLRELYDLTRMGPTSANCQPGRFVFLASPEARERLARHASAGNRPKILAAPVTVLLAYDLAFAEHLPDLFPQNPGAKAWFSQPELAQETAFRNGSLQAAYLILAARALGLDTGPMSGFDAKAVNAEFFEGTTWRINFVCNLGFGTDENLFPRNPRLAFEDACRLL